MLLGDLYRYEEMLSPQEWEIVLRTRAFMRDEYAPIAEQCWADAQFPHHLIPRIAELGIMGLSYGTQDRTAPSHRPAGC